MRLALVGCGAIARRVHLPAFRAVGVDMVAFASGSRLSAEAAAAEWGSGTVYDGWLDAIADVDAVAICAPNSLHAPIAIAAAQAGKHVFVEKPMAVTVAEADAMIAAADAAGVVLMPAHNARFAPPFRAARAAIADGVIGAVTGVRAALGHPGPEAWSPGATWFRDPARAGGGALLDLGIHLADVLRAVLDDEVVEVAAMLTDSAPVDDAAHVLLRFTRGATASLHASWSARPGPDHQLTVFGTEGTLHVDAATPLNLLRASGGGPELLSMPADDVNVCAMFAEAVASGTTPPVTAADGRAAVAIVAAAYAAASSRRTVPVDS